MPYTIEDRVGGHFLHHLLAHVVWFSLPPAPSNMKYALIRCPKCFKFRTVETRHITSMCFSCNYRIRHMSVRYIYRSDDVEDIADKKAQLKQKKY